MIAWYEQNLPPFGWTNVDPVVESSGEHDEAIIDAGHRSDVVKH